MPLLDHFHPPLHPRRPWESVHATWTVCLMEALNQRWLPEGYYADVQTHASARVEIDVATYEQGSMSAARADGNGGLALAAPAWSPPTATLTLPAVFPDTFEVRIFSKHGISPVAAIELVSPSNKDRPDTRRTFAVKCASCLSQGISLIVVDVVTDKQAHLHQELMKVMELEERFYLKEYAPLYAVAYRPVLRSEREEIDVWPGRVALGAPLPTLPLRLTGDLFVPVDFELTYAEACRRLRLA